MNSSRQKKNSANFSMAFVGMYVKQRIKHILTYKESSMIGIAMSAAMIFIFSGCLMTNKIKDIASPVQRVNWGTSFEEAEKILTKQAIDYEITAVNDGFDRMIEIKDWDIFDKRLSVYLVFNVNYELRLYRVVVNLPQEVDDELRSKINSEIGEKFQTENMNVWRGKQVADLPEKLLSRIHTYLLDSPWALDNGMLANSAEDGWELYQERYLVVASIREDEHMLVYTANEMALAMKCKK